MLCSVPHLLQGRSFRTTAGAQILGSERKQIPVFGGRFSEERNGLRGYCQTERDVAESGWLSCSGVERRREPIEGCPRLTDADREQRLGLGVASHFLCAFLCFQSSALSTSEIRGEIQIVYTSRMEAKVPCALGCQSPSSPLGSPSSLTNME